MFDNIVQLLLYNTINGKFIEKYDTAKKVYVSKFYLSNHVSRKTEVEFDVKFNLPITKIDLRPNGGGTSTVQMQGSRDRTRYYYTGTIVSGKGALLQVESKEKILSTFSGIDGYRQP